MSKKTDDYQALADALGLRYDDSTDVLYGEKEGYHLVLYPPNSNFPYLLCIHTAAKSPTGAILTSADFKELTKGVKSLGVCRQEGNNIIVNLGNYPKREKLIASATEGVNALIGFLKNKGYAPCCSICGQSIEAAEYRSGNSYFHLCEGCAANMLGNADRMLKQKAEKEENVIGGVIGALAGSLLGVLCIVLIGMAGYVAAVSGAVMAVCTLKGYEKLGGKLSKPGMAVSVVLMLVMTYVGTRLSLAFNLMKDPGERWGGNLMECFSRVPDAYKTSAWIGNLALTYVFMLLGAIPIITSKIREDKTAGQIVKIGGAGNFGSHVQ